MLNAECSMTSRLILTVERFPVDPEFEKAGQKFKVLRSFEVPGSAWTVNEELGTNAEP